MTAKTRDHNSTVGVKPHNSGLESPGIAISSSWIDESVLEPNPVILSDGISLRIRLTGYAKKSAVFSVQPSK